MKLLARRPALRRMSIEVRIVCSRMDAAAPWERPQGSKSGRCWFGQAGLSDQNAFFDSSGIDGKMTGPVGCRGPGSTVSVPGD